MNSQPDIGALMKQAQQVQAQIQAQQQQAAETVLEGQAGGGMVKVEVTGLLEFRRVTIDPRVVDSEDVEMLQDLVLAALHDAAGKVQTMNEQAFGGMGDLGGILG